MAITTRLLGTYAGGPATSTVTVTLTNAPNAGEYVTAIVSYTYDSAQTASITGYSVIADGTTVKTTFAPYLMVYGKFATGSEGTTLTISKGNSTASDFAVAVLGHTNVDTTTPAAATPVLAIGGRGSGTAPSITPTVQPCRVLWVVSHQNFRAGADSNITWTGATEVGEKSSTFNVISSAYEDRTNTSATGTRAWTIATYGGNTDSVVGALALREATAPTGPEPGRFLFAS